jgi:hypothetical protein
MGCDFEDCNSLADYNIEWWGLNQRGKSPVMVHERYSCLRHLLPLSRNLDLGGVPDMIYSFPGYKENLQTLELISQVLCDEVSLSVLEREILEREGQLTLF